MALIPKFHLIPESFPVKAGEEIIAGQFVALDPVANDGSVLLADGNVAANVVLGVAGDTKSTSTCGLPFVGGGTGAGFQNRVSDSFDETKASGEITVYHAGGSFATNMYDTALTYTVGDSLYVGTGANKGKLTNVNPGSSPVVGQVEKVPGAYDSGVPGVDVNGSITLGNYMEFKLRI